MAKNMAAGRCDAGLAERMASQRIAGVVLQLDRALAMVGRAGIDKDRAAAGGAYRLYASLNADGLWLWCSGRFSIIDAAASSPAAALGPVPAPHIVSKCAACCHCSAVDAAARIWVAAEGAACNDGLLLSGGHCHAQRTFRNGSGAAQLYAHDRQQQMAAVLASGASLFDYSFVFGSQNRGYIQHAERCCCGVDITQKRPRRFSYIILAQLQA